MNRAVHSNLRSGLSVVIGIGNTLLAVVLVVVCLVPPFWLVWFYALFYTWDEHRGSAILIVAMWLWGVCSAGIFVSVALRAMIKKSWSLTHQSLPFVVGGVLCLLAYFAGWWPIISVLLHSSW